MRPCSCGALFCSPGLAASGSRPASLRWCRGGTRPIDIDTFYDELSPYGGWVCTRALAMSGCPRTSRRAAPLRRRPLNLYRRVWLVLGLERALCLGGIHYGRWGYDEDYGWFWVPGDTWAPAWVQWRYSDDYVGWAPVGPGPRGYAYGVPENYEPPIAESWVLVQPRYMASRVISPDALPIGGLGVAFFGATNVYRPIYRGGIVSVRHAPRPRGEDHQAADLCAENLPGRPLEGRQYDRDGRNKGIKVYAPTLTGTAGIGGRRNSSTIRRTSSRRRSCMTPSRAMCRRAGARAPRV